MFTPLTYLVDPTEVRVNFVGNDSVVPDPLGPGGGGPLLPPSPGLLPLHWCVAHKVSLPGSFVPENLPSPQFGSPVSN